MIVTTQHSGPGVLIIVAVNPTPNNADTTLPICGHSLGTNGHVVPPPFGRQITYALFAQALATKFSSGKAVHHN